MNISANHPAVARHRAIRRAVGEMRERPCAIGAFGHAHVHFVSSKRNAVSGRALGVGQFLFRRQHRFDVEEPQPIDSAGRSLDAIGIADRLPEHLIAAAQSSTVPPRRTCAAMSMSNPHSRRAFNPAIVVFEPEE